jgi:thiol:disulfide interchange protein DsbC
MAIVAATAPAHGDPNAVDASSRIVPKDELAARYPGVDAANIHDAPLSGFYEVTVGNRISYVTKDGEYLVQGDIVELATQTNLTENRRAERRAALLAAIDPSAEIVFSPKDGPARFRITVFTDVDCGYCRQFHREIEEVTALGIEVRYVSFPRTGPNTESWEKAERVWCAADRNAALTLAKTGADLASVPGCTTTGIVAQEYDLGRQIGLTGTPAVYAETGVELGGYLPPKELLAALEKLR